MTSDWKDASREFFAQRGRAIRRSASASMDDLCFVSGRDPRLWGQVEVYDDLIQDIVARCAVVEGSSILEVGCASGFLAKGVAPFVKDYTGVDLAGPAITAARGLGIRNATFSVGDGERLAYSSGTFDACFSYDVFTNFPNFEIGEKIISEMLRVTRPGGRVLVGSIPDADLRAEYEARVAEVAADLEERHGAPPMAPEQPPTSFLARLWNRFRHVEPVIVCYYFRREDFRSLGARLGARVEILDIHAKNPYAGLRFNAVFVRP